MGRFGLEKDELLMIDDLKPGFDMASAAGVAFCRCGLGQRHPGDRKFYAAKLPEIFQDDFLL